MHAGSMSLLILTLEYKLIINVISKTCAFPTMISQSCVIPADRKMVMDGNVKLLSSAVEGSVEASMQYLTY